MRLALPLLLLVACSGDDEPETTNSTPDDEVLGCGYDTHAQIRSEDLGALELPDGQDGALEDVLIGLWQHAFIYDAGEPLNGVSDDISDLRFVIPDTTTFIYCQDTSIDVDGENQGNLTIDGNKLDIPGPGYTATWWNADTMIWRNDLYENKDQYYVLVRMN